MTVRIGVVGGGPSGCAAAVALCSAAEAHHSPVDVTVFEKQAPYKGRTFNTGDPVLLLNTSAGVTSVRAENPNDFVSFLATHRPTNPADFVARTEAAAYLQQTMNGLGGRFSRLRVRQMEVRCVEETPEADLAVRSEGSRFLFDASCWRWALRSEPLRRRPPCDASALSRLPVGRCGAGRRGSDSWLSSQRHRRLRVAAFKGAPRTHHAPQPFGKAAGGSPVPVAQRRRSGR
ncbi:hypothetical protein D3877_23245 [Azospirillum cavernae]|uniref:FAD-dependent urate hydroxylase HpyO/Asp monooxygenase CreE-like FAD/NAD(P)-binding domain-containing protein n=1 Tax=Azospirillum cavernae TaxID=2320860 RepID=A0A418VP37_9PROT|nr:hypothetical protein D3877_23245 [Azospirillum cavernae]